MKAYMILNMVEFVFWVAAIAICIMGMKSCSGVGCTYTGILIAMSFILAYVLSKTLKHMSILMVPYAHSFLAIVTMVITTRQFYYRKKHGHHPDEMHWSRVLDRSYSGQSFNIPLSKV